MWEAQMEKFIGEEEEIVSFRVYIESVYTMLGGASCDVECMV
jgi:hypothetical protein